MPSASLSSKVSSWVDILQYRDPLDGLQRMRDFGALSPKLDVFIKLIPSRLMDPCEREGRKIVRLRIHWILSVKGEKNNFLLSNLPTLSKESSYLVSYLYNSETQKVILMNMLLCVKCNYKCFLEKSTIKSDKNLMI